MTWHWREQCALRGSLRILFCPVGADRRDVGKNNQVGGTGGICTWAWWSASALCSCLRPSRVCALPAWWLAPSSWPPFSETEQGGAVELQHGAATPIGWQLQR
eukprot:2322883-Prymnesium_polylepis.1